MSTLVDLGNAALILLGEPMVASLTDGTEAARVLTARIPIVRDSVLRSTAWNFALTRRTLATLSPAPPFGYTTAFSLPPDYLRIVRLNDGRDDYSIELHAGVRALLSDVSTAEIVYISRVTNPALWDPMFFDTLASALALDIAPSLVGATDRSAVSRLLSLYTERLAQARAVDGQENPPGEFYDDDFLRARLGAEGIYRGIS